ncbi:MAG: winged helix-turn-helix domain-containing protein [Rhodanobacteraceae bacterium]|nr:winged helix-turn-helix domain-containing protein [Rhodanobacteraceae bacterium]
MPSHFRFAGFELHIASRSLLLAGAPVAIEPKVFDVLSYLVEQRERAVGRDELIAAVWGRVDVADATLQQAISRLRRVLRETPDVPFVRTVPRHGYQWVAPTQLLTEPSPEQRAEPMMRASAQAAAVPAALPRERATSPGIKSRWLVAALAGLVVFAGAILARLGLYNGDTRGNAAATQKAASPVARIPMAADASATATSPPCAAEMSAASCIERLSSHLSDPALASASRVPLLLQRAQEYLRTGGLAAATADLDTLDSQLDAATPPALTARMLYLRHRAAVLGSHPDQALGFAQRALAIYRQQGPSDAHAELLQSLGTAASRQGELDRALTWLDSALEMYLATKNEAGAIRTLASKAYTLSQLGRFADALTAARDAEQRAHGGASPDLQREALSALAWASIQNGRLSDAREAVHAALALPVADTNSAQSPSLHALLGFIDAAGGRFQEALSAWEAALSHTPEGSSTSTAAGLHLAVIYAALNLGDRAQAQTQYQQLRAMAARQPELTQSAEHAAALLAHAKGDDAQAAAHFAQVWAAARESGTLNQQMLADYADVLLRRNDLNTLETLLGEPALPAREGHLYQLVQARYLAHRGRRADAQAAFDRARALAGERYTRWLEVTRREIAAAPGTR